MNSVIEMLDRAAERFDGKTAMEDVRESVTFSQLRERSRAIATYLLERRYSGCNIAVLLPKEISAVTAFFGCLYSGNTYAPLDYNDARERILKTVSGIDAALVITDRENEEWLSARGVRTALCCDMVEISPDHGRIDAVLREVCDTMPAYIMHTSGSTGEPKGVVVPHRGVFCFIEWITAYFRLGPDDVIALESPFHFAMSVFDIYSCLAVGAKVVITPDILMRFPAKIPDFLEENHITCIYWIPSVLTSIANAGVLERCELPELRLVTFAGEVMPARQLNMWRRANPNREYINLYGSTEAPVTCTAYRVTRDFDDLERVPIGKTAENRRILVLNERGEKAAVDEVGELCITGGGLALGYYGKKEQTQSVFIQNPLNTRYREILYRTGDYGYWNNDGELVFSGRHDTQIKLNSIRIELGDIESAACCLGGVERACALLNEKRLLLFLQTKERHTTRHLKQMLRQYLPGYMVPHSIVEMDEFPRNKSGKIDRQRLLKTFRG